MPDESTIRATIETLQDAGLLVSLTTEGGTSTVVVTDANTGERYVNRDADPVVCFDRGAAVQLLRRPGDPQAAPVDHAGGRLGGHGRLGDRGRSRTPLVPGGKADFNGQLVDVVSEGGFIDRDQPIEVVERSRNRIVVRLHREG